MSTSNQPNGQIRVRLSYANHTVGQEVEVDPVDAIETPEPELEMEINNPSPVKRQKFADESVNS